MALGMAMFLVGAAVVAMDAWQRRQQRRALVVAGVHVALLCTVRKITHNTYNPTLYENVHQAPLAASHCVTACAVFTTCGTVMAMYALRVAWATCTSSVL